MAEVEMTVVQKLKSVTVPILFNILLPVFDVFSDARLIILLFIGGLICKRSSALYDDYYTCREDPTNYCTDPTTNHAVCGGHVSHPKFALMLLVPFLLNYIVSFITWWRNDTNKKISFIFALLNLYAPYGKFVLGGWGSCNVFCTIILEAVKVVWMLLKNPREGQQMKRRYEENIGLHEVFLGMPSKKKTQYGGILSQPHITPSPPSKAGTKIEGTFFGF